MHTLHAESPAESPLVSDVQIGYVGGGSQGWALTLINDLAQCGDVASEVAIYDHFGLLGAASDRHLAEFVPGVSTSNAGSSPREQSK